MKEGNQTAALAIESPHLSTDVTGLAPITKKVVTVTKIIIIGLHPLKGDTEGAVMIAETSATKRTKKGSPPALAHHPLADPHPLKDTVDIIIKTVETIIVIDIGKDLIPHAEVNDVGASLTCTLTSKSVRSKVRRPL